MSAGAANRWRSACSALCQAEVGGTPGAARRAEAPGRAGRAGAAASDRPSPPATLDGPCGATEEPRTVGKALQGYISALRGCFRSGAIETTAAGYRLSAPRTWSTPSDSSAEPTGTRAAGAGSPRLCRGRVRGAPWSCGGGAVPRSGRRTGRRRGDRPAPRTPRQCRGGSLRGPATTGRPSGRAARPERSRRGGAAARAEVGAAHAGAVPLGPPGRRPAGLPAVPRRPGGGARGRTVNGDRHPRTEDRARKARTSLDAARGAGSANTARVTRDRVYRVLTARITIGTMSISVGPRHSVVEAEAPPTAGPSEPVAADPVERERVAPAPAPTGVDSSAGAATRVLTTVLLPFVSVWEIGKAVVRRLVGGALRAVQGSASGISGVARHLGRFLGGLLTPIARSVRRVTRSTARVLETVFTVIGRTCARATGAAFRGARPLWALAAMAAFFVTARVFKPLWAAVVAVTRLVAYGMRGVAWLIVGTLRLMAARADRRDRGALPGGGASGGAGLARLHPHRAAHRPLGEGGGPARPWNAPARGRGLTAVIEVLYQAVALAAVLVWRACTPIGRLIALLAKAVAWLIVGTLRLVGRGLTAVIEVLYRAVALAARAIGRTVALVLRPPLSGATAIMKWLGRTVGTAARSTICPVARVFSWIARSLSSSSGRVHAGLAGCLRHRGSSRSSRPALRCRHCARSIERSWSDALLGRATA